MRDPLEAITSAGLITTGVSPSHLAGPFAPVIDAAVVRFTAVAEPQAELLIYGSVATGQARVGSSDVDLIAAGLTPELATELTAELSDRFSNLCREVAVLPMALDAHLIAGDEAYGNRVFLRHYCLPLAGPDQLRGGPGFPADVRAARGFNGDLGQALARWRTADPSAQLGRAVARKSLLAAASLHSVLCQTWTTDRDTGATGWAQRRPDLGWAIDQLRLWTQNQPVARPDQVAAMIAPAGPTEQLLTEFEHHIGLWAE